MADGLAELQARWPGVPMVFCEMRRLRGGVTCRHLAAARTGACEEDAALSRIGLTLAPAPAPVIEDRGPLPVVVRKVRHDANT